MQKPDLTRGQHELREIRRESRGLLWAAGIFSVFVNLLMLTGPIFMLQIYDRVLGSRSEETLVALFALMAFLFLVMGILDWARGRLLGRMAARFQARLDRRVFEAILRKASLGASDPTESENQLKDVEAVQRFYGSPVFAAVFDIPWTPVFLIGISIFHPWLGGLAILGGGILILITVLNQRTTRLAVVQATSAAYKSDRMAEHLQTEAETVRSLGMQGGAFVRWDKARRRSLEQNLRASDLGGSFSTATKTFRLFLQSAMLGVGAYLVLQGSVTPGVMIASSILLGRALAPVDLVVGQWSLVQRARRGWDNLVELLSTVPSEATRLELPRPQARLSVQQLTVIPPGARQATLRMINFDVMPGQAIGVIGQSGSGKSTLARAITGVWAPAGGKIRLDGAALDQYDPERLAQYIGYLPLGYGTPVSLASTQLSGGQIQRIGLARAMYGDPVILVLDEPNSNLDNDGSTALNAAIRQMKEEGKSVLIMAHRPAAIKECEMLLVLDDGMRKAWGPREKVLSEMVVNHREIAQAANKPVGVT